MSSIINNGKHYLNKINNIIKESSVQSYNIESANDKVKHKIREFKCLKKKNNETLDQFLFRGKIFLKVYENTKDDIIALKYSNIWVNILSLNCTYPKEVMELVEKYKPLEEENIYKNPLEN